MKNVVQVNHSGLLEMLDMTFLKKLAIFIWGTFGIGKSFLIEYWCKQYAKKHDLIYSTDPQDADDKHFVCLVICMHQFDPAEIKGLPVANHEKRITEFFSTGSLPQAGQGIIFFDELNLAPIMVQNNAYQLIWNRQLGEYKLPEGFLAVGAGNTADDRAHVQEMAMPLKNRFGHVELKQPMVKDWCEQFAFKNNIDHRITSFLLFREDYLFKFNPEMMEEVIAVPSPRTWELASKAIKDIEDLSMVEKFVGMYVSAAIGRELADFVKMSKEVNLEKIFKDKKCEAPKDPGELYALLSAISGYYAKKQTPETAETILDLTSCFKAEHATILLQQAVSTNKLFLSVVCKETCPEKLTAISKKYIRFL